MKPSRLVASTVVLGVLLALVTPSAHAGDTPIQTIPFESIPTDTSLVGGPDITLDGPTVVTQDLSVQGEVESVTGGVRFPDVAPVIVPQLMEVGKETKRNRME